MWRAYGGFTFAFDDYTDVNITTRIDDDRTTELFKIVDPIHYVDRLARLPKVVLVSSDDEFMMFEWTNNWKNIFKGETHLYIADNAEHSYATGIVGLLRTLSTFANSVFLSGQRPSFDYDMDFETENHSQSCRRSGFDAGRLPSRTHTFHKTQGLPLGDGGSEERRR